MTDMQLDTADNILDRNTPSRQVLDLIADKWTILVVHALEGDVHRYNELMRMIDGISQKMLTRTLRDLEASGLVLREAYPVIPPKVEYSLTDMGDTLADAMAVLKQWTTDHLSEIQAAQDAHEAAQSAGK